jgi:hypothetical protein
MGHSFLKFKDQVKMLNDAEIVLVVHIILDVTRQTPDIRTLQLTESIKALVDSWQTFIDVYGSGMVGINFNKFVQTDADRDCLLKLIGISRQKVQSFGSVVPADYLNRVVDAPVILEFFDWPTAKLLAAFDKFSELLSS